MGSHGWFRLGGGAGIHICVLRISFNVLCSKWTRGCPSGSGESRKGGGCYVMAGLGLVAGSVTVWRTRRTGGPFESRADRAVDGWGWSGGMGFGGRIDCCQTEPLTHIWRVS